MINWKTTPVGFIGGIVMAAANYSGPNTWQGYVACLAPVALGILAKDFNVTGNGAAPATNQGAANAAAPTNIAQKSGPGQ